MTLDDGRTVTDLAGSTDQPTIASLGGTPRWRANANATYKAGPTTLTPSDNFGYAKPSSIQSLGQCQNLAHQTPSLARQKTHLNPCLNGLPHSCGHRSPKIAKRSEEHTSEIQSLMRISYAVFCLKIKTNNKQN